jgi:predicted dehydrogenase
MNPDRLNILLIGLGKVGMSYDFKSPKSQVLTHSRAIKYWSRRTDTPINVVGVDINQGTQKPFNTIFKSGEWFRSIDSLNSKRCFDLAIIATPIDTIAENTIHACKHFDLKKVVVEKPAASNMTHLKALISLPRSESTLIVGFPRPLLPSSMYLRDQIQAYGKNESWTVDINYGGSVLNILSHFLNLVEFLIEPFKLESFSFNSEEHLNATFKSDTGRLLIHTRQYSKLNDEKNEIHIQGPISISYTNSGRKIKIINSGVLSKFASERLDSHQEISQMIGNFGNKYLNWASTGEETHFTHLSSPSLAETIRLAEAINVR